MLTHLRGTGSVGDLHESSISVRPVSTDSRRLDAGRRDALGLPYPAWRRLPEILAAAATTSSASELLGPALGKAVRRPVEVDRRDDLAVRIGDRCRHRRDPFVEFLERPCVAVAPDRTHPLEQLLGRDERPLP